MQYLGGKVRIAKQVTEFLGRWSSLAYLEPFVGAANIVTRLSNPIRVASDLNPSLIALLTEVRDGTFPYPDIVTPEEHAYYRRAPDSAMRAFVGFGCSFGGKWFGGYARSKKGDDSRWDKYTGAARRSLQAKAPLLSGVDLVCCSYDDHRPRNSLVYCDPPYADTAQIYAPFDSGRFWDTMRLWALDNVVVVSEYKAPPDFLCVLEIPTKLGVRTKAGIREPRVERLFMHKDGLGVQDVVLSTPA